MFWIGFVAGLFVGCPLGICVITLFLAGKSYSNHENKNSKNENKEKQKNQT